MDTYILNRTGDTKDSFEMEKLSETKLRNDKR